MGRRIQEPGIRRIPFPISQQREKTDERLEEINFTSAIPKLLNGEMGIAYIVSGGSIAEIQKVFLVRGLVGRLFLQEDRLAEVRLSISLVSQKVFLFSKGVC